MLNFTGDTFMGVNSNFGKKMYSIIPKNGDLLHRMYLVIDLEDFGEDFDDSCAESPAENLKEQISVSGFSLIDYIEIRIGDQLIDKHTGVWLHI